MLYIICTCEKKYALVTVYVENKNLIYVGSFLGEKTKTAGAFAKKTINFRNNADPNVLITRQIDMYIFYFPPHNLYKFYYNILLYAKFS